LLSIRLSSNALAANPVDTIASSLQSNVNLSQQELEKKAVEQIAQGNLTGKHISQDLNATAEQLKNGGQQQYFLAHLYHPPYS